MNTQTDERLVRAYDSLEGLSVGDAFGGCFFAIRSNYLADALETRTLASAPWPYTDDTLMALSLVSILRQHKTVDQERLAHSFADRYDFHRGYGPSMHGVLRRIREGEHWREVTRSQFEGQGSFGNGAAMRVAPLGAFFADDLDRVVDEARRSADVTHAHPEAAGGAIAVAVAAAWAWRLRGTEPLPGKDAFLDLVLASVPDSEVRSKIRRAQDVSPGAPTWAAIDVLGNGSHVSAQDTVPFVLWCAGQHLDNFEEAMWLTASGLGDVDTTCAMVGGIVATYTGADGIPAEWRAARESLPQWPFLEQYGTEQ